MIKLSKEEYDKAYKILKKNYKNVRYRKSHKLFYWEYDVTHGYYIN